MYCAYDNDKNELITSETIERSVELTIEVINTRVKNIGKSCRKIIGRDEFTFKDNHPNNDNIITSQIEGSRILNIDYPYNDIQYDKGVSEWKMNCANIYFRIYNDLIPNENCCVHNFPDIMNIRRSSGKIQKARQRYKSGFRISQKNTDVDALPTSKHPKLYIRVEFGNSDNDIDDRTVTKEYYKDVSIEDIAEVNPEIKNFDITFYIPKYMNYHYNSKKYEIQKYYCDIHDKWCNEKLIPLFKYIKNKYDIEINFYNIYK